MVGNLQRQNFNCVESAINEFPSDGLTKEQRQEGYIAIHIFISIYIFIAVAIVCENYFVPSVERICEALEMTTDVAGATFMAVATSAPELAVNVIGTFITEGDLGIGTILGSAVFNTLGVIAICCIVSGVTIKLDSWPITRDCSIYSIAVGFLIYVLGDGTVWWYETVILLIFYFTYLIIMYNDKKLQDAFEESIFFKKAPCFKGLGDDDLTQGDVRYSKAIIEDEEKTHDHLFSPCKNGALYSIYWMIKFPIYLAYYFTIPDCRMANRRKLFAVSFLMCCFWIGVLSYLASWMITAIGDTFNIPDSVMGISFLAVGTSIPEAVSSVIVARRGYGSMAICNSIGSNTFSVLVGLGVPWFLKTVFFPCWDTHALRINSKGLVYSTVTLLSSLFFLYTSFIYTKFILSRTVGLTCLIVYIFFLIFIDIILV